MTEITLNYVKSLNYTDFISFLKETNRCPGGKASIREIAQNTFINKDSVILDVGSNTGFNSLELAHITDAKIYGIDISDSCVDESNNLLASDISNVRERVSFQIASSYSIPFNDNYFDLVMCGGATSFMEDKNKAVSEYFRVLKPWGFLATTQLFYSKQPPEKVLAAVSDVIGMKIKYLDKNAWLDILNSSNKYELYYFKEYAFEHRSLKDVEDHVAMFLMKSHLVALPEEVKEEIYKKWLGYMTIFAENNDYLSYFIALFRKNHYSEEKEFFTRKLAC